MTRLVLVIGGLLILVRSVAGQQPFGPPPPVSSDSEPEKIQKVTFVPPPLPEKKTRQKVDKDKLRELARVPIQNWSFGFFGVTPGSTQETEKEKETTAKKIADLEKNLQGNDSDAEKYLELGDLYEAGEKSKSACSSAAKLFEKRLESEAESSWIHIQYAKALIGNGDFKEAEKQVLEGIRISPEEAGGWQALGCLYVAQATSASRAVENQGGRFRKIREKTFADMANKGKSHLEEILHSQFGPFDNEKKSNSVLEMPANPFQEKERPKTLPELRKEIVGLALSREPQVQQIQDIVEHVDNVPVLEAKANLEKAGKCFVKVVALAPKDPDSYSALGGFHNAKRMILSMLGEDSQKVYQDYLRELRDDQRHLAHLCPNDADVQANYAVAVIAADMIKSSESNGKDKKANETVKVLIVVRQSLSNESKSQIARVMKNLRKLADGDDQIAVETSCRALASLAIVMGDFKNAETYSRKALAIQPDNLKNWDNLEMALYLQERKKAQVQVCRDRLAHFPTACSFLRLARWHIGQKDFASAERVLREALKKEPQDIPCQIALAAVLIRRSNQADTLAEAEQLLDQALKEIEQAEDKEKLPRGRALPHQGGDQDEAPGGAFNRVVNAYKLKDYYKDAIFNKGIVAGLKGDVAASWMYFEAMPKDDDQGKTARKLFSD
jgi:tetratricopeptide (TPR) repeat protein